MAGKQHIIGCHLNRKEILHGVSLTGYNWKKKGKREQNSCGSGCQRSLPSPLVESSYAAGVKFYTPFACLSLCVCACEKAMNHSLFCAGITGWEF